MFSLISSHKKTILAIVVIVLLFIGYGIFKGGSSTTANNSTTLARTGSTNPVTGAVDTNAPGKQFVSQLLAIQNIHFNTTLFSDPAYTYLQDFSRELVNQEVGRENPFAPLGNGGSLPYNPATDGPGFIMTSDNTATTSIDAPIIPAATSTRRVATSTAPARR